MSRRPFDPLLYLVVGPDEAAGRDLVGLVLEAVAGGVTMVQLRQKREGGRAFVETARALVEVLRPKGVPLIVNDRVDVALAADADGAHVGQDDIPVTDARRLIGEDALLGLSITSLEEAHALDPGVVDYAGVGPIFATPTKLDAAAPLGIAGTRDICRVLRVPVVAIGGISAMNASEVLSAGAHGLAVVSAICSSTDVRAAATDLIERIRHARTL